MNKQVSDELLMGAYIKGLREEIRAELRFIEPLSLAHAMVLSKKVEARMGSLLEAQEIRDPKDQRHIGTGRAWSPAEWGKFGNQTGQADNSNWAFTLPDPGRYNQVNRHLEHNSNPQNRSPRFHAALVRSSPPFEQRPPKTPGFRRMTEAEYLEKREKGLCFRCGEKFGPRHRCSQKSMQILMVTDVVEDDEAEIDEREVGEEDEMSNPVEITFNALVGFATTDTMKLQGRIRGHDVVVMGDSGATHNFISRDTIRTLQLLVEDTCCFSVLVGDGCRLTSQGVCRWLAVELQGTTTTQNFYAFQLGSADVVLGISWLKSLGDVETN